MKMRRIINNNHQKDKITLIINKKDNLKKKVSKNYFNYIFFIILAEIVTTEIEYLTQIQCYKNANIDIDAFVFHYGMTQWFQALVIRALRRVIKKELGFEFGFVDMFNKIQESYKVAADKVIKDILEKETYIGKSIIPVPVSNVPTEEEKQEEVKEVGSGKLQKNAKK